MTDIADRVATALTGEFYPGQRVRIGGTWSAASVGEEVTIVRRIRHEIWEVDYPQAYWHEDFLEPV